MTEPIGRVRTMEWPVETGTVALSYPDGLTLTDIDDLEALFALTVRIMRRRAATLPKDPSHD
jgi:uncharacterized protein YqjF (DUF2071 family)